MLLGYSMSGHDLGEGSKSTRPEKAESRGAIIKASSMRQNGLLVESMTPLYRTSATSPPPNASRRSQPQFESFKRL